MKRKKNLKKEKNNRGQVAMPARTPWDALAVEDGKLVRLVGQTLVQAKPLSGVYVCKVAKMGAMHCSAQRLPLHAPAALPTFSFLNRGSSTNFSMPSWPPISSSEAQGQAQRHAVRPWPSPSSTALRSR